MKISTKLQNKLICPLSNDEIINRGTYFSSDQNPDLHYPIINNIPILINDDKSLFSIKIFKEKKDTTFNSSKVNFSKLFKKIVPSIGKNLKAKKNYLELKEKLSENSRILIIGGSIKGDGIDVLYENNSFEITESDVSFGPHTKIIFDAHDIPFKADTFDCVIVQAVLEHVLDPQRCVSQIYRVLKLGGILYAETPFIQQVHMRQYDFTRFTYLGHQRLFRNFKEINSGPCCGPGMALAWSYRYFLRSFTTNKIILNILLLFGNMTSFYLKYFDYFLINKPGAYDSASGYFFMGTKCKTIMSDKELLEQYKGLG